MELLRRQRRYGQLLGLCVKHDLAWFVEKLGLLALVPAEFKGSDDQGKAAGLSNPERVRRLFEELGPTFVKMGQILSTRPDLLPTAYVTEFKKLQDDVAALPWPEVRAVAEADLGRPPEELFAHIDETPLAAASIGQVHRVRLDDDESTEAVIKIQRPGIEETIRLDLAVLRGLAQLAKTSGVMGPIDPVAILREFERSILRELDYLVEGRITDEFREQHQDEDRIAIPRVFWEHTRKRLLVLEFIDGIKVSEIERLRSSGHDLPGVARTVVETILAQLFVHGRFHADPHPGNLMVLGDGRLAMIDFGMSGSFDRHTRRALVDLIRDISSGDHHKLADHLLQHGLIGWEADLRAVRMDLRDLMRGLGAGGEVRDQMDRMMAFVVQHQVAFPPDLFFLDKVFGTLEGAVKTLDPTLSMRALARGFLPQLAGRAARELPQLAQALLMRLIEMEDTLVSLPGDLARVLRRADAGHLKLQTERRLSAAGQRQLSRLVLQAGLLLLGVVLLGVGLAPEPDQAGVAIAGATSFGLGALWLLMARPER